MKTLASILTLTLTLTLARANHLDGEYFGILVPAGSVCNERFGAYVDVWNDGLLSHVSVRVIDWSENTVMTASGLLAPNGKFDLLSDPDLNFPFSSLKQIRGRVDKNGKVSLGLRVLVGGGCRYTLTGWRRWRVPLL